MASIKNKVPVAQTGSNTKKKDIPEGNTEIQIKEEPADMEEYLMSSKTVIQTHGKTPVSAASSSTSSSTNQVRLVTPGKTAPAPVPGPVTTAAATPKPTVGIVTRSQAQNLAAQAASKAVPSPNAAKTPTAGAKDIGSGLTPKHKAAATTPASPANGKPALETPKSTTISTNPKRVLPPPPPPPPLPPPPQSSRAVGGAKPGLATPISVDPKARPTLKPDATRVNIPSKAIVTTQKDGAGSQVKTASVTLPTSSKVAASSTSALPKTTPLTGNLKIPAGGTALQKQLKDAKVVLVRTPTAATSSSGTAGKQLPIEPVAVVTSSSECVAQDQPVPCQQTPQLVVAETDPVTALCPDTVNSSGQNADDYAGSYESGSSDIVPGVVTQPDVATRTNSSVGDRICAEDLEIAIKIEPPDDYPDSTASSAAATPARVAAKNIGSSSANQSVKQTVSTSHQAAQILSLVHAGNAAEVTTCDDDTTVVSSEVSSTDTSTGQVASVDAATASTDAATATDAKTASTVAKTASAVAETASAVAKPASAVAKTVSTVAKPASAVAKTASSVLAGSEAGSRLSVVSKPTSTPKVGSSVCLETEGDSSALSSKNKISASTATTTSSSASSAAVGIVTAPAIEIDLSIVKTEPVDIDLAEEPVSSESVPTSAVNVTSNTEPSSSGQAVADTLQNQDSALAELHAVRCSSVLIAVAEEQVPPTTGEHADLTTDAAAQVVVSLTAVQNDTSLPCHGMPQVDSRTCDDRNEDSLEVATVELHAVETSASNQMKDGASKQDSGIGKTMTAGETLSNSCVEPNSANDNRVELIGNDGNTGNGPNANVINSPTRSGHNACLAADDDDDDIEASLLFSGFSGVKDQVPSGNLSMKNPVSGLPTQTPKPVELLLRQMNQVNAMFRTGLDATLTKRIVVGAQAAHQTTPQKPSPAKTSEHKKCEQLVENSTTAASGGAQVDKAIVKRVIPLAKQDKSKRLAEDKPDNEPVVPPAKRSRITAPGGGKENAGLTGTQSKSERKPSFSNRLQRQKILTPCTSQRPSVERKHFRKNPIGKVSDDLWMETSSFLDEDLRSEPVSSEPDYIFEPRKQKKRADLRVPEKGKPHVTSKPGKSYMNQTNRGRILRKEPNVRNRSTRHIRFPFLSQFVKRSADRCLWDWSSCQVEDISASQRQDLLSDLNSVYLGRQPRFLLKPMGHLDGLSLETQLESQLLDFHSVRIIFLEVARDWVRNKPLHLLMTGQLRIEPRTYMPPKRMSKTNTTFENCQKAFCRDICYILADICNLGESDDSLFALPDGVSQFTANRVFRKVKQYLRNYMERMLRTVVADRYPANTGRLFDEDDRRSFRAKVKPKRILKEPSLIEMPVCEKVLPVAEPELVFPETDGARRKDPVLDDSAVVHEKILHGPSKRLSAELSLPVQNSLAAAFDLFSKEAENICQGTVVETRVDADDGSVVNDEASTIIDNSRLYSPTRPTDIEELEMAVLENVEAADVVTAVAIDEETGLGDEACNVISGEVVGKPLSNGKISVVEKALSPKKARIDEMKDGEDVIIVDYENSTSGSVVEDTSHRKKLRSSVARRTEEEASEVRSMKRKKRSKTSREKKPKRKKEKRKSETHPSTSERDRGHKKKRLKYSEEDRVPESKQQQEVALPEIFVAVSKPEEPARICNASASDAVYCDSFTSVVEDVLSSVPWSNFEDDFDPLLPSSKHYRNPYRLSWPLIEHFTNRDTDMLSKLIGIMPDVNAFRTRLLKRGNSFLWSLVLAVFDAKAVSETEEIPQNLKAVCDDQIDIGGIGEDGVKKSVKGNNPLMQAFRQVVEAKRRLSRETQKSKPASSIMKLSAELAALRAAPKSAKPLYKPSLNAEAQNALKISDPNESRLRDTVERSAQLASEALFQLCNDMKMILNEQEEEEDDASIECLANASDFPRIVLPTADSHLGGLSSLVFILYENYERLSKISEETGFSQPASEMDECITINDDDDSLVDDRLDETSGDVKFGLQVGDVNQCVGDAADLEKPNDAPEKPGWKPINLPDEAVILSQCPEIPFPKEVESAVDSTAHLAAEKEAAKVRDMAEVVLFSTVPAMPAASSDRQYISSFPPIGVIKKKSKVISSQGGPPRMVFSKLLIGPALEERLGSAGSVTEPSPLETSQTPVSAQQPSSLVASLNISSVVTSSPLPLVPEVSVGSVQAQGGCETNQPSAASIVGLSTVVSKNDSLPVSINTPSSEASSQPAKTKTLAKSKATQRKFTSSPAASDAAGTVAQDSAVISASALSYVTTAPSLSSAAVAVSVAASVSAAAVEVAVPPESPDESSYSATFPPIPPEKPSSENSVVPPPLPLGEADMLPPPMPPMNLSEMATSGSNTLTSTSGANNSAYYSGYFSSSSTQAQEFSATSTGYDAYAAGFVDPTQVSPWMYDPNMYPTSNQAPILDPSLMAYPPPLQSDPMSYYLQPTNQPPPYLPAAPAGQMFPTYPSGQSTAPSSLPYMQTPGQLPSSFSFPPPNLPPPTVPHPTIPPPAIPHPSIPPPAVFPAAAPPFPTSMPPPAVMPYNAYGPQWTPDVTSQSNQFLPSDYYSQSPGSTSVTTVTSSSASMSVPPPVLDGQQGSLLPESLSIHDMVKHPPPVIPGSNIPDARAQDTNPDHQTDFSFDKDQSAQFSSKSNDDTFNYAAQSFKNKPQDAVSKSSQSRFSGPEQPQKFETENQPWDSVNQPRDGVSGSWESTNTSVEDSWPSQSGQSSVEQGAQGRQQRPTGPLLQKPREASLNIQPRKPPPKDQEQGYDSHQHQSGHQEQPPGSRIRQQGPSDLDQRPAVNRHLQPTSDPRRPGPLPRQSGPRLRQPVPESRQPGSLLRQSVPEPRHPGPQIRQPGSLLRQPGPEQKQSGQPLRQPGTTDQKKEVPQHRPGLQPRQQNPAGQEQKLIGSQSRPSGPQQRLNGPNQGHTGSLHGPRAPERRLLGSQAVGLQSGPRPVAPLMAVPVRRPLEGSANQSAKHDRPVHATPRGPLANTRFFVFNTDRSACEEAEHLLLCSGAQRFDPYNINALRVMPEIRCLLLVHKEDLKHVQRIPSLLRLKRDLRVSFVMFADASDIQQKRLVAFFPRAGTMIMDLTALLACKSDVLDGMCQFMTQQTVEKRTSWKLMLPSNVFNAIDFLKYKYEDEPEEHVRLAEVSQILATYKTSGIVEFLPDNPYRGQPRTTVEYQASCVALQISRLGSYRHFLFVSDMHRNHPDANLFLNNGIDILSIPEFMRCFVSRQVEHQPKLHPPYITRVTMNRFHDAPVSNGTECIAI